MNADTLPIVSAEVREAEERAMHNARKSRTPAEDIRVAIAACARDLLLRAQIVNMLPANSERSEIEEASVFIAFIGEVCRPMDECLRSVIRTASDNCGGFFKAISTSEAVLAMPTSCAICRNFPVNCFTEAIEREFTSE